MSRFIPPPGPGRPKGSKTKQQLAIDALLAKLGCDPIKGMALIALDESNPIEIRAKMFSELAQYIAPKRKAVEHSTTDGAPLFVIMGAQPAATAEDWAKQHSPEAVH